MEMILYTEAEIDRFYTDEERQALADNDARRRELIARQPILEAEISETRQRGDKEHLRELKDEYTALINGMFTEYFFKYDTIYTAARQRYCDSCKGRPEKALADMTTILSTITKNDYDKFVHDGKQYLSCNQQRINEKMQAEKRDTMTAEEEKLLKDSKLCARHSWAGVIYYLQWRLENPYEALVYNSIGEIRQPAAGEEIEGGAEALAMVYAKAESLGYKRPKGTKKKNTALIAVEQDKKNAALIPLNIATFSLISVVQAGGRLDTDYLKAVRAANRNNHYDVSRINRPVPSTYGNAGKLESIDFFHYTVETKSAKITIELIALDALSKASPQAGKLLVYILQKINEQASDKEGNLTRDYIEFTLKDLVDVGLYSSTRSAREGFWSNMPILRHVTIYGEIKRRKGKKGDEEPPKKGKATGIIGGYDIENNLCTVYLEHRADWSLLLEYYATLPAYYYQLSSKAASLLLYIVYLARCKAKDIKDGKSTQSFDITLDTLRNRLLLPELKGNTRPRQTIRNPIEEAIEEIEAAQEKQNDGALMLTFVDVEEDSNTAAFLRGKLRVNLAGALSEYNSEQGAKRVKRVTKAEKMHDRAVEKALIAIETKRLKAQQAAATDHPDTKTDNAAGTLEGSKPHEEHEQTGTTGAGDSAEKPGVRPDGT